MTNLTAEKIASTAKQFFNGEYEPFNVAIALAAQFYASSLELNVNDVLRARYAERMVAQDKIHVENGAEFGLLRTVLNKATLSAYTELFNFLRWVAERAKMTTDLDQITDSYIPIGQWIEALEEAN